MVGGKDSSVTMVGHNGIYDNDDIFPFSTDTQYLDQSIVVIVIAAQNILLVSFQTYVKWVDIAYSAFGKKSFDYSLHQLTTFE